MPSSLDQTAGEIDWPQWAERTPASERSRTTKFSVTLATAISDIGTELEDRVDVDDWRLSTAAPHRKSDGRPYANASPDDPGAVVRWSKDGEQFAVAADEHTDLRDNVREIGLYIREKRKMASRPVSTGQDEFATARLPSADEDALVAQQPPHEVLNIPQDAPDAVVEAAADEQIKQVHPDQGGDAEQFQRVLKAKEAMLDD